jgi:two-component system nitrogen regulation response regulator GlnG
MAEPPIEDVSTAVGPPDGRELPDLVPALTIVSHPLARRVGERAVLEALAAGREALLSRNEPEFTQPGHKLGNALHDPFIRRRPIRFAPGADGGVRLFVEKGDTQVVAGMAVEGSTEFTADELMHGVPLELAERVVVLLHLVDPKVEDSADSLGMVGSSVGIRRVRAAIARCVDLNVPVLIRGETGTGKELVARAIHDKSPRRSGPFVSVNLGAISRDLAAATLFGATRGAFTGAIREREGLFRSAHGGTLFLDEVGEAPAEVQVTLLRVLDSGEVHPVGADRPVTADVRLIAATDANLEDHIRDGRFRSPLLYRLAGYELRIPPLRERREDIGPLFFHFANEELLATSELHRLTPANAYARPWLPAHVAATLVRYAWPGNIRQLRNLTRQLVIGSRGLPQLRLDPRVADELGVLFAAGSGESTRPTDPGSGSGSGSRRRPSDISEVELKDGLRACAWDLSATADRLRIPRPSIYDLIARYPDIRTAGDLRGEEITQCFQDCAGDLDAMVEKLQVSKRALNRRVRELGLSGRPRSPNR